MWYLPAASYSQASECLNIINFIDTKTDEVSWLNYSYSAPSLLQTSRPNYYL